MNPFITRGHGYENPGNGRSRCEAFDGFQVIGNPLGGFDRDGRESRIFRREGGGGTDYSSHSIQLARRQYDKGGLYILMSHGGGREVWRIPPFYDGGALESALLAMPEREQYALLYTLYTMASDAKRQGEAETRHQWAQAFADGRIRKRRAKGGRQRIEIEQPWEAEARKCKRETAAAFRGN